MLNLQSYACGHWHDPDDSAVILRAAATGRPVARGGNRLDFGAMLEFARREGGTSLRRMGLHDRAQMVKALALALDAETSRLYDLNPWTGATRKDGWVDIDGGILTLRTMASKVKREMQMDQIHLDGAVERLSRGGSFLGQHMCVPLQGVAVQINAFNFPVWGMLEKLGPALLAGMPVIVKPARATAYLTECLVRMIEATGLLPAGAVQLVVGGAGDLLDRLGPQDVVSFTGSAATAQTLRAHPVILRNATRFIAEQDSLNATILGPDVTQDTPEFDLFVREVAREMTVKAGQKCTAIRRIIVPNGLLEPISEAIAARLANTRIGDPEAEAVTMGALVNTAQQADVAARLGELRSETRTVFDGADLTIQSDAPERGAFFKPTLLCADDPDAAQAVHSVEVFGPVATLLPYRDLDHATDLANRGGGSLVTSLVTHDPAVAREVVLASGPWNGRIYINDRDAMGEATGHGSPLPQMTHGGPGRAGGGEELGGIRAVQHYMQRVAVQGSPRMLTGISGQWVPGAPELEAPTHPFQCTFDEIAIGHTIRTALRRVTLDDIEHFAHFTGDTFYAHMDEVAARANPFFPGRVAHGYLLLSFAAGLFVQPDPGPVLANTGISGLSFQKPLEPGEALQVRLTAKRKTRRTDTYGEVRWHVTLLNGDGEQVAEYELLTMVAYSR